MLDTAEAANEYGSAALMQSSGDTRSDFVKLFKRYETLVLARSEVGCAIEQLAVYLDSGVAAGLDIGRDLWDQLDPLNQAVLLMHEYIYRWQRLQGVTTSNNTRSLIGFLLTAKQHKIAESTGASETE